MIFSLPPPSLLHPPPPPLLGILSYLFYFISFFKCMIIHGAAAATFWAFSHNPITWNYTHSRNTNKRLYWTWWYGGVQLKGSYIIFIVSAHHHHHPIFKKSIEDLMGGVLFICSWIYYLRGPLSLSLFLQFRMVGDKSRHGPILASSLSRSSCRIPWL